MNNQKQEIYVKLPDGTEVSKIVDEIPQCDNAGTTCLWIAQELGFKIGGRAVKNTVEVTHRQALSKFNK